MYRKFAFLACALVAGTFTLQAQQAPAPPDSMYEYKLLSTSKTSTLQQEMSELAEAGFRFQSVVGGGTVLGGNEAVVVMGRPKSGLVPQRYKYLLLATQKIETMERELQSAANDGYEFKGQTVLGSTLLGKEVVIILERDSTAIVERWEYRLLSTKRTATMEKELKAIADLGFEFVGATIAGSSLTGGSDVITITRRRIRSPYM